MDPEKFAESLRKFAARKASVEATTLPAGLAENHFGFYVYTKNRQKLAVEVWETAAVEEAPVR